MDHIVRPNGDSKDVVAGWECGDETENGSRTVKKVQDPREPSIEERAQHELTHLPYRSWCRHCVRGRGKQMPHQGGSQETSISEVHMDFAFLRTSKMIMSAAALRNTTGTHIAKEACGLFARSWVSSRRCGHEERPGASLAVDR